MVSTRKRKAEAAKKEGASPSLKVKKKVKAADEEEVNEAEEKEDISPTKAAAAEALKALSKGEGEDVTAVEEEKVVNDEKEDAAAVLADEKEEKTTSDDDPTPSKSNKEEEEVPTQTSSVVAKVLEDKDVVVEGEKKSTKASVATDIKEEKQVAEKEEKEVAENVQPSTTETEAVKPHEQTNSKEVSIPATATTTTIPQAEASSSVTTTATTSTTSTMVEEKGEVSPLYVGRVIGKGGEMIRDLDARSGCRIDGEQNVAHGAPKSITYRGSRATIDFAKSLVAVLCTEQGKDADLPLGQATLKKVSVPANVIGKIIGRKGEMIRKIQSESQAKVQVDHTHLQTDSSRSVTITGMNESVVKAEEMISFLCANPAADAMQSLNMLIRDKVTGGGVWGSGPPYPNLPNQGQNMVIDAMGGGGGGYGEGGVGYGGNVYGNGGNALPTMGGYTGSSGGGVGGIETEVVPCAKNYMGRVIGQKGVTINDLQKRSGCDIQINQNVPLGQDCQVTIKGARQGIEMVKQMIQEIIEQGPNHPYAGGREYYINVLYCLYHLFST